MRFCLIGGFPRSGTRQVLDLLNHHPQISLRGEIHRPLIVAIEKLVKKAERCHQGKWTEKNFQQARRELILENIRLLGKGPSKGSWPPFASKQIIGFKLPYVELVKSSIDYLLMPEFDGVDFIYCVRNLEDNFLSQKSKLSINKKRFISNTIESIDALRCLREDPFYRVKVVPLESFINSPNRSLWIRTELFSFLGLSDVTDVSASSYISKTPNRNKTPQEKRLHQLTSEEETALTTNSCLLARVRWIKETYNISLLKN